MIKNYKSIMTGGLALLAMITGCNKEEETLILEGKTDEEKQEIAVQIATEQYEMYDGFSNGMAYADAGMESAEGGRLSEECYTLTYTASETDLEYRIDFGDRCETPEGEILAGAIEVNIGFGVTEETIFLTAVYEFLDYEVDGHVFNGKMVMDGMALSFEEEPVENPTITLSMVDAKHTYPDGTYFLLNREWTLTPDAQNAGITLVTGQSSGKTRIGLNFSATIDEALEINEACQLDGTPIAGLWNASVSELGDISIDYGSGECDDIITMTYNGTSYTIDVNE